MLASKYSYKEMLSVTIFVIHGSFLLDSIFLCLRRQKKGAELNNHISQFEYVYGLFFT